ncbi:MAG: hypothetical protein GTO45_06440 [Candidatus Aminicenantes bacterium]|nr:hypothetical protein [Candidatus Aminicenantes bacterium]NIM78462.1 hypothetical protein [Candidatus Aminicenantes bacterium]NIN17725.1 hypothetical protein [Candidatus Aminicenantes bacterium]NIN41601.1 hypothetical protein [Candidatus Aminicenantes bacterium]NIN84375.1 hypothetical protein [Candidatus Aminicenantes bacterium]
MKFEKDTQKKINKLAEENKDIKVIRRALKECAKSYLKNGYILNKKREREFNDIVLKIIEHNEKGSVIFPTIYHNFLTSEISSMGYYGHKEFVKYLIKIRDDFMKFYFHKRYESGDKKIESFVKSDENIFKAQPYIPENYWIGVLFTAGYTIIIFIIIYLILLYRKKKQPKAELPDFQFHKGNTYFILRKKENEREALFNTYKAMGNTACIDRFTRDDIDVGIKPASQFTYFCKFRGNDINYALETLRTLGIGNIYTMKRKEITGEIMKKIYAAAVLDQNAEIIVLNDFIKNESKDFEEQFRKLLKHMEKQEKIILYLSSEFYEARLQQEAQKDKIPDKKIVRIDLDTVSLR